MYHKKQAMNHTSFWKRFAAALIDGIILNSGLEIILEIINNVVGSINLLNLNAGYFEIILGLVYFAALDSIPKQMSVGKKMFEILSLSHSRLPGCTQRPISPSLPL